MDVSGIAERLVAGASRVSSVLFLGAGVGKRVGLPDWKDLLEKLATVSARYGDDETAAVIRRRTAEGRFLEAASAYKTASIPEGELLRELASPFVAVPDAKSLARISSLVQLPVSAIVTTNYDQTIHRALTEAKVFTRSVELDDDSLRGAHLSTEFFVARLHGRAERPSSMVLDRADYDSLGRNRTYLDFLLDVFQRRTCIFIGFSFLDPAIDRVLRTLEEKFGRELPGLHLALVPESASSLRDRLLRLNIETVTYSEDDGHRALWQAVRLASDQLGSLPRGSEDAGFADGENLPRLLAFAYAGVQTEQQRESVIDLVLDGLVLAAVEQRPAPRMDLIERVSRSLRLDRGEAESKIDQSLGRLAARGRLRIDEGVFALVQVQETSLADEVLALAENVVDRLAVRGLWAERDSCTGTVSMVLEHLFIARAWDVAAHYAGANVGLGKDLRKAAESSLERVAAELDADSRASIASAVMDLLWRPEPRQLPILSRIGRAAFGLQLLLSSPRQALLREHAIPQLIYLDANVVLPAITRGHPFQEAYSGALSQLGEAAREMAGKCEVVVGWEFLNEIVSHRALAVRLVKELNLDDEKELRDHVLLLGPANTNVFVGAFAIAPSAEGRRLSFSEFLAKFAPYTNEVELSAFLQRQGVQTTHLRKSLNSEEKYWSLTSTLSAAYSREAKPYTRAKDPILIEHEAAQMARLREDLERGERPLFVSADGAMIRVLRTEDQTRDLAQVSISPLGLVATVDVIVGLAPEDRSLARLSWAPGHLEPEAKLFDYFVAQGIRNYHEGIGMGLEEAARHVSRIAVNESKARGLSLFPSDPADAQKSKTRLDQYEDQFFQHWREALEKQRSEPPPQIPRTARRPGEGR